ncbi:arginyl-tRNA synthetase class Ic [Sutterella sp. CAG:351]|nr:arginyl-tRNA synthetase class Ic [Sutterella sp. CAG:351]
MLLTEVIKKAARRGDKNINAAGKGRGLGFQVHASENEGGTDIQIFRVRRDVLVDLSREFAGRSQNQRRHFLRLRADAGLGDLLNDRQAVSRGLAGAGLSGSQHVLAFKQGRNGFLLNRGRFTVI